MLCSGSRALRQSALGGWYHRLGANGNCDANHDQNISDRSALSTGCAQDGSGWLARHQRGAGKTPARLWTNRLLWSVCVAIPPPAGAGGDLSAHTTSLGAGVSASGALFPRNNRHPTTKYHSPSRNGAAGNLQPRSVVRSLRYTGILATAGITGRGTKSSRTYQPIMRYGAICRPVCWMWCIASMLIGWGGTRH